MDGILGYDALSQFAAVELNWADSTVCFHPTRDSLILGGGARLPFRMKQVSASRLPFVSCTFGSAPPCEALLDTGSPVTMVTPELCAQAPASMRPYDDPDADIYAAGVDGQMVRMRATSCDLSFFLTPS